MIVWCAWCGAGMGQMPPYEDERPTHGLCPACLPIVMAELLEGEEVPHCGATTTEQTAASEDALPVA